MALSDSDLEQIEQLLGRKPSAVETVVFDTMWSEHCSYKSSKPTLKTLPTTGKDVILGVGEDSGIVYFTTHNGTRYGIALSHESHNHPSQVLPVEGAATGVGGVVRDVYCMGADVIGVLDSLHFGINENGQTPLVEEIAERVVKGVSDYGNALGVPVLGGETLYHSSYNDNCLVNVAALGLVAEDQIIHSFVPDAAKTEPYDVILFGKSTDSTGFGGASFSSDVLDSDDEMKNLGAVQVHDPFLKRVIVDAIQALMALVKERGWQIGFKDLGAGGISCATSELGVAAGLGVSLNLDDVNVAVPGLPPEVIACSETQERFCLVVPKAASAEILELFNTTFALPELYHKAGAAIVGEVTAEPRFVVRHQGALVCDLPIEAITTDVHADRKPDPNRVIPDQVAELKVSPEDLKDYCLEHLALHNNVSKRYIYRFYDNAVRGDTVIYPGEADSVVITPISGSDAAVAVSMDSNLYGNVDPYVSGAAAVAESVRNVVAVGAQPIAVSDCLNYGSPEQPSVFYDFQAGVKGIGDAARALSFDDVNIPVISGNVSFYNESKTSNAVVPSPVICCVGRMPNYRTARTMQVSKAGLTLVLVGRRYSEFGATQIATAHSEWVADDAAAPQVRLDEEAANNLFIYQLYQDGLVEACHDISVGGLWQAASEMVFGERGRARVGLELQLPVDVHPGTMLFAENGGYLVAVETDKVLDLVTLSEERGVYAEVIGSTVAGDSIYVNSVFGEWVFTVSDLLEKWNSENLSRNGTSV